MIRTLRTLLALSLLLAGPALAGGELRTFDLRHRSAEEIIPLLRPLLPQEAAISGRDYLLLIRAPESALQDAAEILQRFDTPSRQLLITVQQGDRTRGDRQGFGVDTRHGAHVYGAERQGDSATAQHLRTLEGRWARIETGEAVPLPRRSTQVTPGRIVVQDGIEYRQFGTGFEVQPRVAGRRVILSVRPFRQQRAGGGRYESEALVTEVEGGLGEWIEIGGAQESRRESETGIIYHRAERKTRDSRIRLKVELVQ